MKRVFMKKLLLILVVLFYTINLSAINWKFWEKKEQKKEVKKEKIEQKVDKLPDL